MHLCTAHRDLSGFYHDQLYENFLLIINHQYHDYLIPYWYISWIICQQLSLSTWNNSSIFVEKPLLPCALFPVPLLSWRSERSEVTAHPGNAKCAGVPCVSVLHRYFLKFQTLNSRAQHFAYTSEHSREGLPFHYHLITIKWWVLILPAHFSDLWMSGRRTAQWDSIPPSLYFFPYALRRLRILLLAYQTHTPGLVSYFVWGFPTHVSRRTSIIYYLQSSWINTHVHHVSAISRWLCRPEKPSWCIGATNESTMFPVAVEQPSSSRFPLHSIWTWQTSLLRT